MDEGSICVHVLEAGCLYESKVPVGLADGILVGAVKKSEKVKIKSKFEIRSRKVSP